MEVDRTFDFEGLEKAIYEAISSYGIDIYDEQNDMLIFKNTYDDPENGLSKQIEIARTDPNAPEELYFVHIQIKDMDSLPDVEPVEEPVESENLLLSSDSDNEKSCSWCCFCWKM